MYSMHKVTLIQRVQRIRCCTAADALLLERTTQACAVWTLWSINMSSENIRTADRIRNANSVWCVNMALCVCFECVWAHSLQESARVLNCFKFNKHCLDFASENPCVNCAARL